MATQDDNTLGGFFPTPLPCDALLPILERYEALASLAWDALEQDSPVACLLRAFNRDFRDALGALHERGLIHDQGDIPG